MCSMRSVGMAHTTGVRTYAAPSCAKGRFHLQEFQSLIQLGRPDVHGPLQIGTLHRLWRAFEHAQNLGRLLGRRKRRPDEIVRDLIVLCARHEDALRLLDCAPGAADLLVVVDHRSGPLEVNHKAEIGFIEAHAQRDRRDKRLHLVGQQPVLQFQPLLIGQPSVIGARVDTTQPQPCGEIVGIPNCQRVDDAAALELRNVIREPRHSRGLGWDAQVLQPKALANQRAADNVQVRSQLSGNVVHHAFVRGGGGGQHRQVRWQRSQHANDAPVVRAEIVPPIGDAMCFVHNEEPHARGRRQQAARHELLVPQSLGRDQKKVCLAGSHRRFHRGPVFRVRGVDGLRANPDTLRGGDLVSHQGQQRRDQ